MWIFQLMSSVNLGLTHIQQHGDMMIIILCVMIRYGGAITAALFLQEFVAKKKPFAHIDIGEFFIFDYIIRYSTNESFI